MILQVKNLSKIVLCASLLWAAVPQAQAETSHVFTVSATQTVEFAEANYDDGTNERFQWTAIDGIATANTPWRVLTREEWTYLLVTRDASKNALGQVDGANGLIILPDNWTQPVGTPAWTASVYFTDNRYTAAEWNLMKAAGAVFLPCRGASADGTNIDDAATLGAYWASTSFSEDNGYCVRFYDGYIHDQNNAAKNHYYSIRLVKDAGSPTGMDQIVNSQSSNRKIIKDGRLYIFRDGKMFDIPGTEVK